MLLLQCSPILTRLHRLTSLPTVPRNQHDTIGFAIHLVPAKKVVIHASRHPFRFSKLEHFFCCMKSFELL